MHHDQVAEGKVRVPYSIFIPKAYGVGTDLFSLVLLTDAFQLPGLKGLSSWADEQDVILVAFTSDVEDKPTTARAESLLAALATGYRIQPALRFSADGRGSVNRALASGSQAIWGGLVCNPFSVPRKPTVKDLCIGLVSGPERDFAQRQASTVADFGLPYRITAVASNDASWNMQDDQRRLLDWMLQWQRLAHPALPPAARKAELARLQTRVEQLIAAPEGIDQERRLADCDRLLEIDPVAKTKHAPALRAAWCDAALALALVEAQSIPKHRRLEALARDERAKAMPAAQRKIMQDLLAELRKDKAVRVDSESLAALDKARALDADRRSGRSKGKPEAQLRAVIIAYEQVGTRWPGTDAATLAANAIKALEREL